MTVSTEVTCPAAVEFTRCGSCGQLRFKSDTECPKCHEGGKAPHFYRDLDVVTDALAPAVITLDDGTQWIDTSRVDPDLLAAYRRLLQYGYANGLLAVGAAAEMSTLFRTEVGLELTDGIDTAGEHPACSRYGGTRSTVPVRVTVRQGKAVVYQAVIPWCEVATAEKTWTLPLGQHRSRFKFSAQRVSPE